MILAAGIKVPELALEQKEAKALGEAMAGVAKHYPNTVISPVAIAWVNLATCMGMTYGPRVYMVRKRIETERRKPAARTAPAPTQEAQEAAAFIQPGFPGGVGPVADASTI